MPKGHKERFGGNENVDCGGSYSIYTFVKTCQIVHFKCVQFIVHNLYLNSAVFESGVKEMETKECHRNTTP